MSNNTPNEFARRAQGEQPSAAAQFFRFVFQNKKWWLTPILVLLVVVGALILLGGSGVAPFIYSLF
jgi:hypothetical protein